MPVVAGKFWVSSSRRLKAGLVFAPAAGAGWHELRINVGEVCGFPDELAEPLDGGCLVGDEWTSA